VARIVTENRCGIVIPPHDADALAAAVLRLRDTPHEAAAMGARARTATTTLFDRRVSTYRWHELLQRVMVEPASEHAAVPASGNGGWQDPAASSRLPVRALLGPGSETN
jgi:hypothetical protein